MSKKILTINGYDLFEVVSAFQKEIRRCNEMDAMYWGVELYNSGFIPYAWKRMIIMSTEDIGLANPMATVVINSLYWQYKKLSESKNDPKKQNRLPYVQAILYLTNSPKSRHTDWALNYHFDSHHFVDSEKKEIPDYAIDIHTRKGKQLGKTIDDFFNFGSFVRNHDIQANEDFYRSECRRRWSDDEWIRKVKAREASEQQSIQERQDRKNKSQGELFT